LKYKANRLREGLDAAHSSMAAMDEIEDLYEQSVATKNEIIRANLRLVVSIAKRYATSSENLFELVSDGNISLIRAVEKFDFGRGFKFSTYATWAIIKNFARTIPMEHRYHSRFHTTQDEMLRTVQNAGRNQPVQESAQTQREQQVAQILGRLDDREQQIIRYRFGLDHAREPMTLKQVGEAMGVTKERIRQLETRAIAKLRKAAYEDGIEVPDEE
jgi:RNA polymerase primary sigma factor